eukprot:4620485-Pyramimonas_sp.AAC.1
MSLRSARPRFLQRLQAVAESLKQKKTKPRGHAAGTARGGRGKLCNAVVVGEVVVAAGQLTMVAVAVAVAGRVNCGTAFRGRAASAKGCTSSWPPRWRCPPRRCCRRPSAKKRTTPSA